jgi:hypothetical protein
MATREPVSKSIALLGSLALIGLGALGVVVTVVALVGLTVEGRFSMATGNPSLIVLLCSAVLLGFGVVLYHRGKR